MSPLRNLVWLRRLIRGVFITDTALHYQVRPVWNSTGNAIRRRAGIAQGFYAGSHRHSYSTVKHPISGAPRSASGILQPVVTGRKILCAIGDAYSDEK